MFRALIVDFDIYETLIDFVIGSIISKKRKVLHENKEDVI